MNAKFLFIISVLILASCSPPKYAYKFDYHDYNAGRKEKQAMKEVAANPGPVELQPELLVAEAPELHATTSTSEMTAHPGKSAPLTLTKAEKKAIVKDFKAMVKKAVKMTKADDKENGTKAMDHDLKMSLIFLVVAVAASLLYWVSPPLTAVIWLIAIIISLVFFIKWLAKQ